MSIINDALKKAQKNMSPDGSPPASQEGFPGDGKETAPQLGDERFSKSANEAPAAKNSGTTTSPPAGHPRPPLPPKNKNNPLPQSRQSRTFVWIGAAVIFLLALAAGLSKFFGQWPFGPNSRQTDSARLPESPDGLLVSGIMTMGDKRVALINDEIYELGDIVNGMRIVEIEADQIHLSYGNQQIKILKVFGN